MWCRSKPSSSTINLTASAKMGTAAPLAIGTRGTIASLVRKEIEYFKTRDLDCASYTSKRHQDQPRDNKSIRSKPTSHAKTATSSTSTSSASCTGIGHWFTMGWRKRKKRRTDNNSGSFLPSMCSAVDVNEGNRLDRITGFSYRSLKADVENNI